MITSINKLLQQRKNYEEFNINIDNDVIFIGDDYKIYFEMNPQEALVEALELLGFNVEYV